ncbi:hypothetical protein JL722_12726 [Aureococcus anophagefferens]|nr:hypothetical protein JL722_12726 [Aureococcus anophagefferens]
MLWPSTVHSTIDPASSPARAMVGRRAVAALLLALVSAVAEDAAEDAAARLYLVEGVAPAAGRLEAAAVERAVEALSLDVASGGLAPPSAVAAGERAVAAGLGFAGAALLNNAASNDFAAAARVAAAAVVDLDPGDLAASATALAGAEADVVVYLALGLSHVTYNLARCRLAPVQVVFGHGHPMSAGLGDSIDYFVSSKLYEADVANLIDGDAGRLAVLAEAAVLADVREPGLARPPPIVLPDPAAAPARAVDAAARRAARLEADAGGDAAALRLAAAVPDRGDGGQAYDEQLVLFESPTIGFPRPPEPPRHTRTALGLPEDPPLFACPRPRGKRTSAALRRARLQHSKKLHPDFDASLAAVFAKAPGDALVLMLEGARTHLARLNATLGPAAGARLVFLPRMPREDLLAIVRVSDALLDTHPGAAASRRNAWLFEADKAADEWARFLRNVARRTHLVPPPMVWPWAASRDAHAAQRAKDVERGYL